MGKPKSGGKRKRKRKRNGAASAAQEAAQEAAKEERGGQEGVVQESAEAGERRLARVEVEQEDATPFTVERLELALGASIEEVKRLRREVEAAISRAFDAESRARELEHARFAEREKADESQSRVRALAERLEEAMEREKQQAKRLEELKREALEQAERAAKQAEKATRAAAEQALKKTEMRARAEIRKLKGEIKHLEAKLASERVRAQAREAAVRAGLEEIVGRAVLAAEKAVRNVVREGTKRIDTQAAAELERLERERREDGVEERMRRAVLDAEASAREALEALERTERRLREELGASRREAAELREQIELVRREAVRDTEARLREMLDVAEQARREALNELARMREENERLSKRLRLLEAGEEAAVADQGEVASGGSETRLPVPRSRAHGGESKVEKTRLLSTAGKRYLDWDQPIGVMLPAIEELLGEDGEREKRAPSGNEPSGEAKMGNTVPFMPVPEELGADHSQRGDEFEPDEWSELSG